MLRAGAQVVGFRGSGLNVLPGLASTLVCKQTDPTALGAWCLSLHRAPDVLKKVRLNFSSCQVQSESPGSTR